MTGNRTRFLAVSAVVTILLTTASWLAAEARRQPAEPDSLYKYLSVFTEVFGLVRQAYVKDTDVQNLMAGAYEGAADSLGAFATYVPADDVREFHAVRQHPAPDTGLLLVRDRGWIYVAGVEAQSPAEKAGFQRGDLVSKVDNEATRELQEWQIEAKLARKQGGTVPFTIVRQGESKQLQLPVKETDAAPVALQHVRNLPVLRIARFESDVVPRVAHELAALAASHDDKLAIDLRGVAGGDAEAAYKIGELLASGELGELKARDQVERRFAAAGQPQWKGRLVVLVDRGTLGAPEVLARVLQEAAGATLVGEPTFGHAGHQGEVELQSGGLVELTDAFYTGPKGKPIDEAIAPDQLVDERSRTLREKDLSIDDLILQRGLNALEKPAQPAQKAA